jgi:trehalose 6-phosphate synthase/phosphatase
MSEKELNDILKELTEKAYGARKKLMLLDFDGTLIEFSSEPGDTEPSEELLDLLYKIAVACENQLVIITGRKQNEIDRMVGHLPIDIIAEHGAIIRENGNWGILIKAKALWKKEVLNIMNRFCETSPRSFVEEKNFSLAWHFRNVDPSTADIRSFELTKSLKNILAENNLRILNGNKVIEVIDSNINKGNATKYFLSKHDYDYILSVGDDTTDEDMFRVLMNLEHAVTVKIGDGVTCAKYKLENIEQVLMLLQNFKIRKT